MVERALLLLATWAIFVRWALTTLIDPGWWTVPTLPEAPSSTATGLASHQPRNSYEYSVWLAVTG